MNNITISGTIQNIEFSHSVNGVDYNKAIVSVPRVKDKTDTVIIKYKVKENKHNYKIGDIINISGSIRTHNTENGTEVYIYTHLDKTPDNTVNRCELSGRICKIGQYDEQQQKYLFVLANNIFASNVKINNYIPCIAWKNCAKSLKGLPVNTKIKLYGKLQSHLFKKNDETYIAYQVVVDNFNVGEE